MAQIFLIHCYIRRQNILAHSTEDLKFQEVAEKKREDKKFSKE